MFSYGLLAAGAWASENEGPKGRVYESEWKRYADPATELEVYRLTDPSYSSMLPGYCTQAISRNSGFLLYACDRGGAPEAFYMDLKTGATRQLTQSRDVLDGDSINLLPDNRSFCYFAGRSLFLTSLATLKDREVYTIPEGSTRSQGLSLNATGTHAIFAEWQGDRSRIRMVDLRRATAGTLLEVPFRAEYPIQRPPAGQILYRAADQSPWLVDPDGRQNRPLKLGTGTIGPGKWAADGRTFLYLNFPADAKQLNTIREYAPNTNTDRQVAKTSQYVHFGFNRNTSVFVGASRSVASPVILILLRLTGRELTLCEHRSSHPETVAPRFAPDAQRVYFQSDRHGKPAIYSVHVERLVEKINE